MQVDMFVKLGKLLQEAEPSESTEITEVIEEHPGYDVSEENQINLNRQRFTLQQRENHLEELYRKTSEIHANPKKMEDLLLEETRKRLLKSEDLLARHMQMLDSACSWIQQV